MLHEKVFVFSVVLLVLSGDAGVLGCPSERHPRDEQGDDIHSACGGDGGDREPERGARRPAGEMRVVLGVYVLTCVRLKMWRVNGNKKSREKKSRRERTTTSYLVLTVMSTKIHSSQPKDHTILQNSNTAAYHTLAATARPITHG